jgi:hypothetical protein
MSSYAGAVSDRNSDHANWLFSVFSQACFSLQERSATRRGPFIISDEELSSSVNENPSRYVQVPEPSESRSGD